MLHRYTPADGRARSTWREDAACVGSDPTWFDDSEEDEHYSDRLQRRQIAFSICDRCPVTTQCLDEAIRHYSVGTIRGGRSFPLTWHRVPLPTSGRVKAPEQPRDQEGPLDEITLDDPRIPDNALKLATTAGEHGWEVRCTFAQYIDKLDKPMESIAIRAHRDNVRIWAIWIGSPIAKKGARFENAACSNPLASLSLRDLTARIATTYQGAS